MYRLQQPAEPLRPYIENYWWVSHGPGEAVDLRVDVFVDARADLIFNFEASYRRDVIGGAGTTVGESNLDAQRLVPIRISQHGLVRIVGVRFRLGGLAPFTTERLSRWSNQTPAPELVLGSAAAELEQELGRAADLGESGALLDSFFLKRLRRDDAQVALEAALAMLTESGGRVAVAELAESLSLSSRTLERLFARGLGFPPKTVARVLRFQSALRALMTDPDVPLGEVAADAGFFDHAHFIRDFRAFTGGVPRGYKGYFPPEGPDDFAPNVVAFLQDGSRP